MQLFGGSNSGHSYKARLMLLLSGTPHIYQWVDIELAREQRAPAFIAASKFGEVPVLLDEGVAYCQSNSILLYLAQKTGQFSGASGQAQQITEWLCWESNRIGFSLPNLRYSLRVGDQAPEVLAYLRKRMLADLHTLNASLAERAFLVGEQPSIADISCAAYLYWLDQVGIALVDYPHLARWLAALAALPGWLAPDEALQKI